MTSFPSRVARNLRTNLLAGLLVMVPVSLTILVFRLLFRRVDAILGPFLYRLLARWHPELFVDRKIPGLGIIATLFLLYVAGSLTRVYLGRQLFALWETFIGKIPFFGTINKAAKQIMATLTAPHAQAFRRVVFVRFPQAAMYVLGFVTGEMRLGPTDVRTLVFVPHVPNPTGGYLFLVEKSEIIESNLTVEEGIRMVVSAGISHTPATHAPPPPAAGPQPGAPAGPGGTAS